MFIQAENHLPVPTCDSHLQAATKLMFAQTAVEARALVVAGQLPAKWVGDFLFNCKFSRIVPHSKYYTSCCLVVKVKIVFARVDSPLKSVWYLPFHQGVAILIGPARELFS